MKLLFTGLGYQLVWFLTAKSLTGSPAWLGAASAAVFSAICYAAFKTTQKQVGKITIFAIAGTGLEFGHHYFNIAPYSSWTPSATLNLFGLWIAFGLFTTTVLSKLFPTKLPYVLSFAIAGPVTYYTAMKLGALTIPHLPLFLLYFITEWTLLALLTYNRLT